jgi:hypothetical protein
MLFEHIPTFYLEVIGIAGFVAYVLTYTMLTLRLVTGDSLIYFCMNLGAASMVMVGLMASFNLASALIQAFWIAISVVGISMRIWRTSPSAAGLS